MPLKGIKVIELAGLAPVPFCGMVLADFGATVIRVSRVGSGLTELDVLANGKKSMNLDLKQKKGVQILKQLCKTSDVLIEPYRRGVMEKLSLGPDILLKENPKLIYARLTGYGQDGYYADRAGHDINYLSITGLLSLFARKDQKPTAPVNLAADFGGGGLMCAFGIVAALFERTKFGKGQVIDANMVSGTAYMGSWLYRSQQLPIWGNPTGENLIDTGAHFYDTYKTKDGKYLAVGCLEPQFYAQMLEKLHLNADEFDQHTDYDAKSAKLSEIFLTKTQHEWAQIFDATDACVTPVLSLEDAKNHIHNVQNNTFQVDENGVLCPTPAPKLSKTPGESKALLPAPESGEHTREILQQLNYSNDEILKLEKDGVVETVYHEKSKL